jgi:peptidoglycan pentaglycine glycine transferase (the first glycine)
MTPGLTASGWEAFLSSHPEAHLLQTAAWGELKAEFGWGCERLRLGEAGAQVLFRRLAPGMTLAYAALGPVGEWLPGLLPALDELCRARGAFALKVEPDEENDPARVAAMTQAGLVPSPHTVQPRRTLLVDLTGEEAEVLARMNQKTRYNIGLASRRGVRVEAWDDLGAFGAMMRTTAARDRFGAHHPSYYRRAYELFSPAGACALLVARVEGVPVASLMVFARGRRAWYLYGASTERERQRMPNHLLQWEAMRWARARGCATYDLWGVPDEDLESLEGGFSSRSDGLWGVYRFKRGFGGRLVRSLGAWDRAYRRPRYAAYRWLMTRRLSG